MTENPPRRVSAKVGSGLGMWPKRPRRRRALLPQVLELLAIVVFMVGGYHATLWAWEQAKPAEVEVPEILAMRELDARKLLEGANLQAELVADRYDEEVPEGGVLTAEPPPGRRVKVGRIVRLTLSLGSRWSVVPDVREMSVERARALLRQERLAVGQQQARYHPSAAIGYVIGHAPEPGQRVPRGTTVDLWVSKGPEPTVQVIERSPETEGTRSTEVELTIPPGASVQEVRVVVRDRNGQRTVYRDFHRPGETVTQAVSGEGPRIVIRVFLSGLLVQERSI